MERVLAIIISIIVLYVILIGIGVSIRYDSTATYEYPKKFEYLFSGYKTECGEVECKTTAKVSVPILVLVTGDVGDVLIYGKEGNFFLVGDNIKVTLH